VNVQSAIYFKVTCLILR